ncbi:hypothetical protein RN001_015874 [Aquatica leii]|uniref:Gelsolin-like domain-containing protein n=1 Tax=Aquatica leii TaxID=1421715 RepID=A0AAN7NTS6_9COLE|nr:hypothetical protein RN001_015874 [Aquatica leii]
MIEPAFVNAGKVPGIEIWRIEDFKPVPYPKKDYGKFYSGDSYIILHTKEKSGVFSWDLHFWLGTDTSQDESGAAAMLSVILDEQLGGDPVQYREVQEHESQLFLSHFQSGIRYLPGGVSSGFAHVDRNAFEKKLFQVKGKRNIRVKQVPLSISSMNKGDCFILDAGNSIYVYVGAKSKRTERLKAIHAANLIRDQDHGGRSKINVLDEFSLPTEIQEFFDVLGHGSPADVPDESTGGDDEQFETSQERTVALYRVSDSSGRMQIQQIGQKPLKQNQLDVSDCFILETGDANLFVWIGKQCNKKEKSEAMVKAQDFLKTKNYPTWTHVERIVQDAEPSTFRQYFQSWQGTGELHPRAIRSAAAKPTVLAEKSGGELPEFMPDDGSGEMEIYRVENFELVPVPVENYGKFFGGDSYVIKYRSTKGKWLIYYWQGNKSSIDEKAAAAIHAVRMDNELSGSAVQIRVVQDYEPKHFLHMFKGKMITFLGGHSSGFKNIKEHDTYVDGETRLYRVRGTNEVDVRASQQVAAARSLESDDVFIVENGVHTWLWFGKGADDIEKELGHVFVERLVPGASPIVIQEGEETVDFWDALGGRTPYSKNFKNNLQAVTEAKLFHCHVSDNGHVRVEEIPNVDQNELDEDDVMVVDSTEEIFVWVGKGATEHEIKHVFSKLNQILRRYQREKAVVISVKQGAEPELFTMLFPSWNPKMWSSGSAYNDLKQKLQESNKTMG